MLKLLELFYICIFIYMDHVPFLGLNCNHKFHTYSETLRETLFKLQWGRMRSGLALGTDS